jgi:hypothetical protein
MTGELQPLVSNQRIVQQDGTPTEYFIRWAQQRQIDIGAGITSEQALLIIEQYIADHVLTAGSGIGLTPSGNIADNITIAAKVQEILDQISSTQGTVLYRGAAGWAALAPGTSGNFLKTNGVGADPAWAAASSGGGVTTLGLADLTSTQSPGVNNYVMKMVFASDNFTINKVAFYVTTATPTTKYQAFVYASSTAGVPAALLGSSAQITGVTAGYNEAALSASLAVTKGSTLFIGVNPITAGLNGLWVHGSARGGFAANGGSTVPSNPAPALTFGQPYGFWGVA